LSSDVELIVKAIEGLQTNIVKDYILPVSTVLISGFLGAGVAYYTVDRQEQTKIEIEKIKTINETLLVAMEVRSSLISIKLNYSENLKEEPISRMLTVPPIMLSENKAQIDFASLSFLVTQKNSASFNKWASIDYISTIFSNYNTLLSLWAKRNEIIEELLPTLKPHWGKPLNLEMLQELIGVGNMSMLSDLTERALHMTDDVLIEVCSFMLGFSEEAKTKVNKRAVKKFGNVLQISLPNSEDFPKAVDILSKVTEVDYPSLAHLQGRTEKELRDRYRPIYT
jgi:uncharacterized protein YihD (DUF1040 family)